MAEDTVSKAEAKIDIHLADCKQYRISTERRLGRIEKLLYAVGTIVLAAELMPGVMARFFIGG